MSDHSEVPAIECWAGPECTLNRVGDRYFDQIERSGHGWRIDDLERWAALGVVALRYPVLWERTAPESLTRPDWAWLDRRLERLRALGIRPIAGLLHHGSGPRYTSLLDPRFPAQLARFAAMVARRYPWITEYTPVNEPLTTARFSGLYGHWYPHRSDDRSFVRALLNQVWGVVLAMRAIREVNPAAQLVQTEDCGRCYGTTPLHAQVTFDNHRRWLTWDLLTGHVDASHPLREYLIGAGATTEELDRFGADPTPPQVVGLNYYVTSDRFLDHRVSRYPAECHGGNGRLRYADVEAVRARWHGIAGHAAHLSEAWQRYGLPVALTEVHLACTREEQIRWLGEAWHGAEDARAQGVRVKAVTPWALLGSFDWDSLVTKARDHYECGAFDVRAAEPRSTALASAIRGLAAGDTLGSSAIDGVGWWRRRDRLLGATPTRSGRRGRRRHALMILGSAGTLGRAFSFVAERRGLAVVCMDRSAVDVTNGEEVRRTLQRWRPWAVVNATGYVKVDEAERSREACFQVNATGALRVAEACRALNIRLVTFSSDLVFDGAQKRPYTEEDVPRPMSVYGASKAEAERQVLATMPGALVVRTSAFFGPWDESNFVVRMLDTIRAGRPWTAPSDIVVSPTFVPDLVQATLDLLMDDESGIWHLTNDGAMSWFELAQAAAQACGESSGLIEPATAATLGWPAPRPVFSALSSRRGRMMPSIAHALTAFARSIPARARACA